MKRSRLVLLLTGALIATLAFSVSFRGDVAHAASLTTISDTLSTLQPSTAANHTVRFVTPSGLTGTTKTIEITFPTGFGMGSVNDTDVDLAYGTASAETDYNVSSSAGNNIWGAEVQGQKLILTFPSSNGVGIGAGESVIVEVGTNAAYNGTTGDQQVTNPAAADNKIMSIRTTSDGATTVDSGSLAISISTNDPITINATVNPSLAFSIQDGSIGFGAWTDTSKIRYATLDGAGQDDSAPADGDTLTVSTNAPSGATITVLDAGDGSTTSGLYKSSAPTHTLIARAATSVAGGTEGFGVYGTGASSLTVDNRFDNDADGEGAIDRTTAYRFAYSSEPVSGATVEMQFMAAISGSTPAGAYSDTITVVCTGNY